MEGNDVRIICMPADAEMTTEGAVFDRRCATCSRFVMLAATGQRLLRERPEIEIMCLPCFQATRKPDDEIALAAPEEEIDRELDTLRPNLRRERN
ncbi:MAG TPA: hypothetical protein VGG62_12205 [Terracidiphilus sp.]|jgi:hypothetical protein